MLPYLRVALPHAATVFSLQDPTVVFHLETPDSLTLRHLKTPTVINKNVSQEVRRAPFRFAWVSIRVSLEFKDMVVRRVRDRKGNGVDDGEQASRNERRRQGGGYHIDTTHDQV